MKTVLITGASSGIGMTFARAYARKGYRIIVCARREEKLKELCRQLDTEYRIITADLSEEKQCFDLLEQLENEDIDIFINNAGLGLAGCFLETDLERELNMIRVNDIAMHILFKEILRKMNKRGKGTILNVASSAGLFPGGPNMAGYYASKAYVVSLTRAVVQELKETGSNVYVCALCPGPVNTEFNQNADVVFTLKGISPEKCVEDCLRQMEKHATIIVPSVLMKAATSLSCLVPKSLLVAMTGMQQKRKIGR